MEKKNEYRVNLPIAKWPELDRKMAIIARMTSDPPAIRLQKDAPELQERTSLVARTQKYLLKGRKSSH